MALELEDFNPGEVRIFVRHSEHSNPIILLCDFTVDSDGNDATHWEVGIRGHFFTEEEVSKALELFPEQDKVISWTGIGDKLMNQRFSSSGPFILAANVAGKSITEKEAKFAQSLFFLKERIAGKVFDQIIK